MHDHKWDEGTYHVVRGDLLGWRCDSRSARARRALSPPTGIGDTSVRIFVVTLTLVIGLTLGEAAHIRQRGWPGVLAKREETRRA